MLVMRRLLVSPPGMDILMLTTVIVQLNSLPLNDARKRGLRERDEVWTEYLTESERRDSEMLEACDKNMDFLLIFVGC